MKTMDKIMKAALYNDEHEHMDVMMRVLYASRFQDGIHMQHYPRLWAL